MIPEYNLKSAEHDADMLEGCVNRIFVTDDITELENMQKSAHYRIDKLVEFHRKRIEKEV